MNNKYKAREIAEEICFNYHQADICILDVEKAALVALEQSENKIKELGGLLVGASATVQKLESDLEEMTEKRNSLMIKLTSKMDRGEFYANFLESLMIDKLGVTLEDLELAKKEFDSLDPQLEKFKEPVEEIPQFKGTLDGLNALLYGYFKPDQREMILHERLELYYQQTPDEMDNRTAMGYWQEFKRWCAERGYTQKEINRAKRNVRI